MTSKSSLWVKLMENYKRRIWLIGLEVLMFVIVITAIFLMSLTSIDKAGYAQYYGNKAGIMIARAVKRYCTMYIGISGLKNVVITAGAVLSGMCGFMYLNNKSMVDFYVGMPEKKVVRFAVSWLNGIISFAITYLIGMLLCMAILVGFGYGNLFSIGQALYAFIVYLFYFIGVYNLMILSVSLTGNLLASLCAFIVFSLYEFIIRTICLGLRSMYFTYEYQMDGMLIPWSTPYGPIYKINELYTKQISIKYVLILILFDVVALSLAYLAYSKRPLENAGKTIVYKKLENTVKLLIAIPATVGIGAFIANTMSYMNEYSETNITLVIIFMIIIAVIICALIQAVFELDVKGIINKKIHMPICAVAAIAIFMFFNMDPINIDRYVPSASAVESVAFVPFDYTNNYLSVNKDMCELELDKYCMENMFITDASDVCKLASIGIQKYDEAMDNYDSKVDDYSVIDEQFSNGLIIYRMKSGRTVLRKIFVPVNDPDVINLVDNIMAKDEFVKGYFSIESIDIESALEQVEVADRNSYFSNGIYTKRMSNEDIVEFVENYRKDLAEYSYKQVKDCMPIGTVRFQLNVTPAYNFNMYDDYQHTMELTVYKNMKNCRAYLANNGYTMEYYVNPEDIEKIVIYNYHYAEREKAAEANGDVEGSYEIATDIYLDPKEAAYGLDLDEEYTRSILLEEGDYENLIPELYPAEECLWRWDKGNRVDTNYDVRVFFKAGTDIGKRYSGGSAGYGFLKGQVPENIVKALKL